MLQIAGVLQLYRNGYEALDAKAIALIYPTVDILRLQNAFNQLSKVSYDVKLPVDGIVVARDGLTATVTGSEAIRFIPKIGSAAPQTGTVIFTLRKRAGIWVIQSVKSNTRN
jgi:hypothetical protein